MFRDLDWRGAFKRSVIMMLIYASFLYVLSVAFPQTFGISNGPEIYTLFINGVVIFLFFAVFYAFTDRSRRRREAEMRARRKAKKPEKTGEEEEGSPERKLSGRLNPNTNRKKATRRRR